MSRFRQIRRVAQTGSTNDDMARILGEPHSAGLTLVADYQRHGSGRKGRAWIAPPGSALLFTTALPEPVAAGTLWLVPFWSALAVHDALRRFGVAPVLQWPNDVLLHDRKLAGILCISRVTGESAWAAAGIGVNVVRPSDPAEITGIDPPPAFVSDAFAVSRDDLLGAILDEMDRSYALLSDAARIITLWNDAARIPGAAYRIAVDGEHAPFEAVALTLQAGGSLLVECNGTMREITLADARVLRS